MEHNHAWPRSGRVNRMRNTSKTDVPHNGEAVAPSWLGDMSGSKITQERRLMGYELASHRQVN
jgi:hypothetical protein